MAKRGTWFTIALNGFAQTYSECIASQRVYCEKHNYSYFVVDSLPWRTTAQQSAWLKVEIMRALISSSCYGDGAIGFIDADCEVRAHTPPFSEAFTDKPVMLANGKSGRLNSGVIFAKCVEPAHRFFELLISRCDESVPKESRTRYENGHFIHFGAESGVIGLLDHAAWNNNSAMNSNSFIQHFSGGELRKLYLETRVRRLDKVFGAFSNAADKLKPDSRAVPISDFLDRARSLKLVDRIRG